MTTAADIFDRLSAIAEDPVGYAQDWKGRQGRKVVGVLPMNFPLELVHAAGALPFVVQESREPITIGHSLIFEFYCGYTRSITDQAATHQLDVLDGLFLVDHCVALLGAADAIRFALPDLPIFLAQFTASMDEPWTKDEVAAKVADLRRRLGELTGTPPTDADLRRSIALYNRDRQILRQIYELRRRGRIAITAAQMQVLVKSAMVMDVEEHLELLGEFMDVIALDDLERPGGVRLHLSGHFCHAPRPELLSLIESCGATVIDDDLYTGYRFISTDVHGDLDPEQALVGWYFERNDKVPCSTRAQKTVDWETYLIDSVEESGAEGVIILLPKFCEPHMLYYPELRKALLARDIPHLLLETEHEGLPVETVRVRMEAFVERIKRGVPTRLEHGLTRPSQAGESK